MKGATKRALAMVLLSVMPGESRTEGQYRHGSRITPLLTTLAGRQDVRRLGHPGRLRGTPFQRGITDPGTGFERKECDMP
jgi:hypothetical protein